MFGFLRGLLWGCLLIGAGWFVGSAYPAPSTWTAAFKQRSDVVVARLDLSSAGLQRLREQLTSEEYSQLTADAAQLASASGHAVVVERFTEDEKHVDAQEPAPAPAAPVAPSGAAPSAVQGPFADALQLCPGMTVSNAPGVDAQRRINAFKNVVSIDGVMVATNPAHGACLSSGFGARNGRMHDGLDFHSADGGPIAAAANGVVIEKKYRDDYGNMLLIDHGKGVYTRYAHLSSFAPGVEIGSKVSAGQQIGLMGNTAGYRIPIHLHYEILLGDYNTPKASFGLTPESPFKYASLK
jgi:murein DD-endopeptidase MepM/ murein hydrolase activator NlpD